jgi:hypothetical protein
LSLVLDIVRSYRTPRRVLRERIGTTVREDRALATLFAACALMFVAQWPRLSREAFVDDSIALEVRMTGALFGWMLVAPLAMYFLALLSQAAVRLAGRDASGYDARMALFWAFLASSPLWLLTGLASGFLGQTVASAIVGAAAFSGFLVLWASGISEISGRQETGVV